MTPKRGFLMLSALILGLLLLLPSPLIEAQSQGGAFVPTANYTVTGQWTFTKTPNYTAGAPSGALTITAASPNLTLASGQTNTGKVIINGKTSGSLNITTADATAVAVTVTTAAQTVGATTLTIPDQAGTSRNFVFDTLTQTLTNKTLTAPVIATISNTGTITNPSATGSAPVIQSCGNTGSGNQTCSVAASTALGKVYQGSSTLSAGGAVITFPVAFTSTTSYFCVANDQTTTTNGIKMASTSSSTATLTGTGSDVIQWICAGQ
jgi:hypothetical protein